MAVRLTWTDPNTLEEGFRVYRSTSPMDPDALPTALAELPADTLGYTDETAAASTTYYYRVSTYAGAVEKVSDEIEVITGADDVQPAKLMLGVDEILVGLDNNLLLSGDMQSGTDLMLL